MGDIQFWVVIQNRADADYLFSSFDEAEKFAKNYIRASEGTWCSIAANHETIAHIRADSLGRIWTDSLVMPK
jgi:hypothetical protein